MQPRGLLRPILIAVVAASCGAHVAKMLPQHVERLMWPFWSITYRYGFVRRGLVGTIFRTWAGALDEPAQLDAVLAIHRATLAALVVGLAAWSVAAVRAVRAARPHVADLVAGGAAATLLSAMLPTLAQTAGYYDVFVVALASAGAFAAHRGRFVTAGAIAAAGPVIHDAFVFLWAPVLLLAARSLDRRHATRALALLAPLATTLVVQALHSRSAIDRMISEARDRESLAIAYHMTGSQFVERMTSLVTSQPEQLALAAIPFLVPSLVVAAFAFAVDGDPSRLRAAAFAAAATLAPCAILVVAWDLSRFLVWSAFGAFLALVSAAASGHVAPARPSPRVQHALAAALVVVAVASAGGPFLYAYFHVAYAEYPAGPAWTSRTPAAYAARAWLRLYNRRSYLSTFPPTGACGLQPVDVRPADAPCAFGIAEDGRVETEFLWLHEGSYAATVETSPELSCADARAVVAVRYYGRFAPPAHEVRFDARTAHVATIPFEVDAEQAAIGRLRVVVWSEAGCFVLRRVAVDTRGRLSSNEDASLERSGP